MARTEAGSTEESVQPLPAQTSWGDKGDEGDEVMSKILDDVSR